MIVKNNCKHLKQGGLIPFLLMHHYLVCLFPKYCKVITLYHQTLKFLNSDHSAECIWLSGFVSFELQKGGNQCSQKVEYK